MRQGLCDHISAVDNSLVIYVCVCPSVVSISPSGGGDRHLAHFLEFLEFFFSFGNFFLSRL